MNRYKRAELRKHLQDLERARLVRRERFEYDPDDGDLPKIVAELLDVLDDVDDVLNEAERAERSLDVDYPPSASELIARLQAIIAGKW